MMVDVRDAQRFERQGTEIAQEGVRRDSPPAVAEEQGSEASFVHRIYFRWSFVGTTSNERSDVRPAFHNGYAIPAIMAALSVQNRGGGK